MNNLFTTSYASPFVLMVRRAGIKGLDHVINAVALIAAVSVANANLYVTVCFLIQEGCRDVYMVLILFGF